MHTQHCPACAFLKSIFVTNFVALGKWDANLKPMQCSTMINKLFLSLEFIRSSCEVKGIHMPSAWLWKDSSWHQQVLLPGPLCQKGGIFFRSFLPALPCKDCSGQSQQCADNRVWTWKQSCSATPRPWFKQTVVGQVVLQRIWPSVINRTHCTPGLPRTKFCPGIY